MKKQNEIQALINLLDDPDESIYIHIREKIKSFGSLAIPHLEEHWELHDHGSIYQSRIEIILKEMQYGSIAQDLKTWRLAKKPSLLEGVSIVSRYQHPDFSLQEVQQFIDRISQDIWIELNPNLTAYEKIRVINQLVFDVYGFKPNTTDYHAPQNSYFNEVIANKTGNPISLSILYLLIAEKLSLPIQGINLPRHFILSWSDQFFMNEEDEAKTFVLFYINPFSKGDIFGKDEIDMFLQQVKISPKDEFYYPCDNIAIIRRVINNLIHSYKKLGEEEKVEELKNLIRIVSE